MTRLRLHDDLDLALPTSNGSTGRDPVSGKFLPGNPGGPGNPYARRCAELRQALLDAVTLDDVREIAYALLRAAKRSDVPAAKVLLDRLLGRVPLKITAVAEPWDYIADEAFL